jgi:hypothetical protein
MVGAMGEPVAVGNTVWAVAFTEHPERVGGELPRHGRFVAVGLIIGNRGSKAVALGDHVCSLRHDGADPAYRPVLTAWGTPEQLRNNEYQERYLLPPDEIIAGLIFFDVANTVTEPRLLVRDLTARDVDFTAVIDLTTRRDDPNAGGSGLWTAPSLLQTIY